MNRGTKTPIDPSDEASLVSSTRETIAALLPSGDRRIETVANLVGVSPRTLQRLLGRQSLTYSELVDDVRLTTARRLLDETECRLSEIAVRLGYSDAAHFTRAFRRWTGRTPSDHRRIRKSR